MTDIEGSTGLWERSPRAMAEALLVHNEVVRAQLQIHQGYEIKSEGDAFALAFADPLEALRWCLEVNAALSGRAWPSDLRGSDGRVGLRVRAGLHVGEPMQHLDPVTGRMDYLGPAMNRAARVSAAGHGGQVLLSDAAWQALGPALPEGWVEIEDLGLYTLRGLTTPERIRMVRGAHLTRRRFPPLRAARWRPSSPLAGRDQFVGRATDLATMQTRLSAGCKVLTLRGPGGTGKTRLARRYGAEQEACWPGGVVFCDLTEARTGPAVVSAVARALELNPNAGDAQIGAALAGRGRALLILDNLEQVVEAAAPLVAAWAEASGESAMIVTSRIALGVPGEIVLPLAPLPLPDPGATAPDELLSSEAAELFVERAMERGATFTLAPQTCVDIAALVRRLDGLPLAIELAAAWSRLLSPAAVLQRVSVHLDPLRRAGDGRVGRQATLRAVVAWSWELLQPWERAAFAQLAVFEGGLPLEVAHEVIDLSVYADAPPVEDVLERLVDHSLVQRAETPGRLHMLVTLQDFAAERLAALPSPMSRPEAEARHRRAFADLIDRYTRGAASHRLPKAQRAERENLIAASRRAMDAHDARAAYGVGLATVDLLVSTGPQSEAVQLGRALLRTPGLSDVERAHLSVALGDALRNVGLVAEARQHLEEGGRVLEQAGEIRKALRAQIGLGVLSHDQRDFGEARARYEGAISRTQSLGSTTERALALICLGHLNREAGDWDAAEQCFRGALSWCPPDDTGTHWRATGALALLQLDRGRAADAALLFREVAARARAEGDRVSEIAANGNLAGALAELGQTTEALTLYQHNMRLARSLGNQRLLSINLGNLGDTLVLLGRHGEAEDALREAVSLAGAAGVRDAEGAFRGTLAVTLFNRGEVDRAWSELEQGAAMLSAIPNPLELLRLRVRQAALPWSPPRPMGEILDEIRGLMARLGLTAASPVGREAIEILATTPIKS